MHGNNHAKKALLDESERLSKKAQALATDLNNGASGDIHVQGRALATMLDVQRLQHKMLEPLFLSDLVTEETCMSRHAERDKGCMTKIKVGPMEYQGKITSAMLVAMLSGLPTLIVAFLYGKNLGWW